MAMNDQTQARQLILKLVKASAGKMPVRGREDLCWPGCPLGHFPLGEPFQPALRSMIEDGTLVVIERPRSGGRSGTAKFVAKGGE